MRKLVCLVHRAIIHAHPLSPFSSDVFRQFHFDYADDCRVRYLLLHIQFLQIEVCLLNYINELYQLPASFHVKLLDLIYHQISEC